VKLAAVCLLVLMATSGSGAAAAPAVTIVVTNTADSGAGSLRQAILDSNASAGVRDHITFSIPGSGLHTIAPATALPVITDPVFIDGSSQPGYIFPFPLVELNGTGIAAPNAVLTIDAGNTEVRGLAINRGPDAGIRIMTIGGNTIGACAIGTDPTGTIALGNATHGVLIENVPGNNIFNAMNVISGNGLDGVRITGAAADGNSVRLNAIGTDWQGDASVANGGFGVRIIDGSNTLVENNMIAYNGMGGVLVEGSVVGSTISSFIRFNNGPGVAVLSPATGIRVESAIVDNTGLPVDLGNDGPTPNDAGDGDTGANNLLNSAELIAARIDYAIGGVRSVQVTGRLRAEPSTTYTVVFYVVMPRTMPNAQAITVVQYPVTGVTTDPAGDADLFHPGMNLPPGAVITSMVLDANGNTSEYSASITTPDLVVSSGCGLLGLEMLVPLILAALALRRRG
jgi:hypothetical protein